MNEETVRESFRTVCDNHKLPEELLALAREKGLEDLLKRAYNHAITEATFESEDFHEITAEAVEKAKAEGREEQYGATGQSYAALELVRLWKERHPGQAFCCVLGDERMLEIITKDIFRVLQFGTKSQPIERGSYDDPTSA